MGLLQLFQSEEDKL